MADDKPPELSGWSREVRRATSKMIYAIAQQVRKADHGKPSRIFDLLEAVAAWLKPPDL